MGGKRKQFVRRLADGAILPVVAETETEICVEEMFPFDDGGSSPRPLRLWHPKSRYAEAGDRPRHGGLKEIIASGKAPGARVQNPADGKKPPQPLTKETK